MIAQTFVRVIVRSWIRAALWFRFRKIRIVFHSPIPLREGAILAGNHQNAMLDSMTLAVCSPNVPFTLSKGALFQGRVARWFLAAIRMVPVYRFRDGFRRMRENPEVFKGYVEILRDDNWLLIFPEGGHFLRYTLRPFQKGVARIVFAAQEEQGWNEDIPIIPVGIQYESHTTFGARLLIQYGHPVSSLSFREAYARNPKEAERALTTHLSEKVRSLLILPPSDDQAHERALLRWSRNKGRFNDLMDQFTSDSRLMSRERDSADPESTPPPASPPEPGPPPETSENGPGSDSKNGAIRRLTGYTLSLPGVVLHLPVIFLTLAFQKLLLEDQHMVPAWRFVAGMVLVPLWYLAVLALGLLLGGSPSQELVLLLSMPLTLWLWSRSWHLTR